MRASMILPILLFATVSIPAQQSLENRARSQYRFPPDHMACPVDLRVDRRASVISREVDGKPIPTGQGLDLHFGSTRERSVVSADITVHGYTGRVIAQPLKITPTNPERSESFHLTSSSGLPLSNKLVWTASISGITWVELRRVDFSDGTSWQSTIQDECRVEPSLFVPVK